MPFTALGLSPELARAAGLLGFATPTPVQQQAIPAILRGTDVLGTAPTGSGKTAAYALPLLQRLHDTPVQAPRQPRVLVVVPTRELAVQVGDVVRQLAQHLPRALKIATVFGGVSVNPQMMALRGGADLVVATPGRLLDLVDVNALSLAGVAALVLDEADRLLDLGFADELRRVLALLPPQRQNLFFSATFPPDVAALAGTLLHAPERVHVAAEAADQPDIVQRVIAVDEIRRTELLRHLMAREKWDRTLVFVATQYAAVHVADKLHRKGIYASPFHGGMSQGARKQVLAEFKEGRWDVLVTTDLASRGIDIPRLPVVVNYDLPRSADQYVHRIGRTGRAQASGLAVSFVGAETEAHWRLIEKRQGLRLPREQVAGFEPQAAAPAPAGAAAAGGAPAGAAAGTGGVKGKRPSKKDKLRAAAAKAAAGRA
jgi:ATP-dependent RNA helicase RhlE